MTWPLPTSARDMVDGADFEHQAQNAKRAAEKALARLPALDTAARVALDRHGAGSAEFRHRLAALVELAGIARAAAMANRTACDRAIRATVGRPAIAETVKRLADAVRAADDRVVLAYSDAVGRLKATARI